MSEATVQALVEATRHAGLSEKQITVVSYLCAALPDIRTVTRVASRLCMSSKALRRQCAELSLPAPQKVLAFGRVFLVLHEVQMGGSTFEKAAMSSGGYGTGGEFSSQMYSLTGIRPAAARTMKLSLFAQLFFEKQSVKA